MKERCQRSFVCLVSAGVSCAVVALVCLFLRREAILLCGGEFIYPIDDTYIHIKMAKTLAEAGTWGIEPGTRAFCSSSPLWTLVLAACYFAFGWNESLPWFLALLFNLGSVVLICGILRAAGCRFPWCAVLSCAIALAIPVYCTTALGMEHSMHAFFILATLLLLVRWQGGSKACGALSCVTAFCATGTRYESLFFLLPLGVGLAVVQALAPARERGTRLSPWPFLLLAAAVLPVLIYGGWAVCAGGHFLPNSLLLKGRFHSASDLVTAVPSLLLHMRPGCLFLYVLAAALAFCCYLNRMRTFWSVASASAVIAIGGQLLFADVGQLCRYEAYLVAVGLTICLAGAVAAGGELNVWTRLGALAVLFVAFAGRSVDAWRHVTWASSDIRAQQVTMTRIVSSMPECDRGCIALNDLGYLSLHGGAPVLDLWGLGSQDVAELNVRHRGEWDAEEIEMLMKRHDVRYALLFESWYPRRLMPDGMIEVGYLALEGNRTCGGDKVAFRATSRLAAEKLHACMKSYDQKRLPPRAKLVVWPLD